MNETDEWKLAELIEFYVADFGVHLTEFTLDPEGVLAVRQLASVLLKQYVETHWCSYSDKFRAPETTEHAKATIKGLLPHGLKESISKVIKDCVIYGNIVTSC